MTETLVGQQPADSQELAKQVRSHPFVDGPTRKLVRSWIQHDPPPNQIPWTPLTKPLGECRVALVSSAGIARAASTTSGTETVTSLRARV